MNILTAKHFLNYLDSIFQVLPSEVHEDINPNTHEQVSVLIYKDIPEKGMLTAVTYGLSEKQHPRWQRNRPELMITVKSDNTAWAKVLAFIANDLTACPFDYGNTINLKKQIASESDMNALLVFAPAILQVADYDNIAVGADYSVSLKGIYPIYDKEIDYINRHGLDKFWNDAEFDVSDVTRTCT